MANLTEMNPKMKAFRNALAKLMEKHGVEFEIIVDDDYGVQLDIDLHKDDVYAYSTIETRYIEPKDMRVTE